MTRAAPSIRFLSRPLEIESDNKLDKSSNHLQEICAQTGPAVRTLIHASLISSMLASAVSYSSARNTLRLHRCQAGHQTARRNMHPSFLHAKGRWAFGA
jgi:hypothetical protein